MKCHLLHWLFLYLYLSSISPLLDWNPSRHAKGSDPPFTKFTCHFLSNSLPFRLPSPHQGLTTTIPHIPHTLHTTNEYHFQQPNFTLIHPSFPPSIQIQFQSISFHLISTYSTTQQHPYKERTMIEQLTIHHLHNTPYNPLNNPTSPPLSSQSTPKSGKLSTFLSFLHNTLTSCLLLSLALLGNTPYPPSLIPRLAVAVSPSFPPSHP